MKPLLLGIDPGLSGALALLNTVDGDLEEVIDMPLREIRGKKWVDLYALAMWLDTRRSGIRKAIIEEVHSMPNQGVASTFRFGYATGAVTGAVTANMIPATLIPPTVWKMQMGVTHDKATSLAMARKLWAPRADLFKRKKDDGRAEAALLAEYGRRLKF